MFRFHIQQWWSVFWAFEQSLWQTSWQDWTMSMWLALMGQVWGMLVLMTLIHRGLGRFSSSKPLGGKTHQKVLLGQSLDPTVDPLLQEVLLRHSHDRHLLNPEAERAQQTASVVSSEESLKQAVSRALYKQKVRDQYKKIKQGKAAEPSSVRFFEQMLEEHSTFEESGQPLVLVVDDSKAALIAAQKALEDLPYRIDVALDGRVAWAKMIEERPALVITDLDMPEMDGMELLRRMRSDLRFMDVPVILVTSKPFDLIKQTEHIDGLLSKPYQSEELKLQVHHFLKHMSQ